MNLFPLAEALTPGDWASLRDVIRAMAAQIDHLSTQTLTFPRPPDESPTHIHVGDPQPDTQ